MLNELRKINEKLIVLYNADQHKLKEQLLIKEILINNNCFKEMTIEDAYSILNSLNIPKENIKSIYEQLLIPIL